MRSLSRYDILDSFKDRGTRVNHFILTESFYTLFQVTLPGKRTPLVTLTDFNGR